MSSRNKHRLGIIFGGRSGEHEVSLMSARSVMDAIDLDKYEIIQIGITHDGAWLIADPEHQGVDVLTGLSQGNPEQLVQAALLADPTWPGLFRLETHETGKLLKRLASLDVVFPVLHGTFGEDGTLQGLLEMADLAYVGAGVLGSAVGMDKAICKDVLRAHGIPLVESILITRRDIETDIHLAAEKALQLSGFPLFVKPANLGSSVGVTKCSSRSDLLEGLFEAARFDRRVLVERGVKNAREIEISVLGNEEPRVSVPGEVIPSRDFYSYEAKYIDDASDLIIPAPISAELTRQVQAYALQAYRAIDCAGMARVDFLLEMTETDEGDGRKSFKENIYLSELNTIPGFTRISMYPKLWEASGLPYPALIDRLIELAIRRKNDRDHTERRFRRDQ